MHSQMTRMVADEQGKQPTRRTQKESNKTLNANRKGETLQQIIDVLTRPMTSNEISLKLCRAVGSFRFALINGSAEGLMHCDDTIRNKHVWSLTKAGKARRRNSDD